jgi:hypothetical protein
MLVFRSCLLVLSALLFTATGCGSNGQYQLSWSFTGAAFQPGDCGAFGVSAISIAGTNENGGTDNPIAPCAPGTFTRKLSAGTWTLVLTALDASGQVKAPAPSDRLRGQTTVPVEDDHLADAGTVTLPPLPQCDDGVDNDHDGRVDLDDADCLGNPENPIE